MPTPNDLFAWIVFGAIGMAAFIYGKKAGKLSPAIIGIALMVYPYFFSQTWLLYAVGGALTVCLFVFRE